MNNSNEYANKLYDNKKYKEAIIFYKRNIEYLLNENIEYFLEESSNKGLHVNLTTNGILLNKVGDKLIKAKSLRQVNISLHSFEANKKNCRIRRIFKRCY